ASAFRLPEPASSIPNVFDDELVIWRTAFVSLALTFPRPSSISAAAPLTTVPAMLVPDNWLYAPGPPPATCRCGYVPDRYDPLDSAPTTWTPGAATSGFNTRSNRV